MICPDCGTRLTNVSISNLDKSYRCFMCGGFLTEPSSVNRISSSDLAKLVAITPDASVLRFGAGTCPNDGFALVRFQGESVPSSVLVKRCKSCGFWWWPNDNLLRYKPAQEAKVNYFKQWGIAADLSALTLPVLVLAVLGVGLGVGIYGVRVRHQLQIEADAGVSQYSATYLGNGVELITFRSRGIVSSLDYKLEGSDEWSTTVVENVGNNVYQSRVEGLTEDRLYLVRILTKEYEFETN